MANTLTLTNIANNNTTDRLAKMLVDDFIALDRKIYAHLIGLGKTHEEASNQAAEIVCGEMNGFAATMYSPPWS